MNKVSRIEHSIIEQTLVETQSRFFIAIVWVICFTCLCWPLSFNIWLKSFIMSYMTSRSALSFFAIDSSLFTFTNFSWNYSTSISLSFERRIKDTSAKSQWFVSLIRTIIWMFFWRHKKSRATSSICIHVVEMWSFWKNSTSWIKFFKILIACFA